jgi:hypothetical protein
MSNLYCGMKGDRLERMLEGNKNGVCYKPVTMQAIEIREGL